MHFPKQRLFRIGWRALQIGLLVMIFVAGGIFLPMRFAPAVFDYLPYTTPQEQRAKQWSVQVSNRNVDSGEQFLIAARSPGNRLTVTDISYSCAIEGVQIVYPADGGNKRLPCETKVVLPGRSDHRLQVYTSRNSVAYLPITVTITNGVKERDISVVLATSQTRTDEKSRVDDRAVVTFKQL